MRRIISTTLSLSLVLSLICGLGFGAGTGKNAKAANTNDPYMGSQWQIAGDEFLKPGTSFDRDSSIGYFEETDDENAPVVAVLDDGVDYTHEDLKDKMWVNTYKELEGTCGYDFVDNDDDPMPSENDNHGTSVAGIIAAETSNGIGITGVSKNAKIMALRVMESAGGTFADQLKALDYVLKAKKLGVNVVAVNCSFGMQPSDEKDKGLDKNIKAIDERIIKLGKEGVLTVFAAGNESMNIDKYPYGMPFENDDTYTILTGAVDYKGEVSCLSNVGKDHVDLMAPGASVLTTTHHSNSIDGLNQTFNPSIYPKEMINSLCRVYDDFSNGINRVKIIDDIVENGNNAMVLSKGEEDIHGDKNNGCLKIHINPAEERTNALPRFNYKLFFDVSNLSFNSDEDVYISFALSDSGYTRSSWYVVNRTLDDDSDAQLVRAKDGKVYISVSLIPFVNSISDHYGKDIYLDSLAISKDIKDPSVFGKYDNVSGTSFAAPMVTGAIARLASLYPDDNALTRKAKLLAGVKKHDKLTDACRTGGTLDVSTFADLKDITVPDKQYKIKSITLNKTKATLEYGSTLTLKATVNPSYADDTSCTWSVNNASYASVSSAGKVKAKKKGIGHTVKITCKANDGSGKKSTCKVSIKKASKTKSVKATKKAVYDLAKEKSDDKYNRVTISKVKDIIDLDTRSDREICTAYVNQNIFENPDISSVEGLKVIHEFMSKNETRHYDTLARMISIRRTEKTQKYNYYDINGDGCKEMFYMASNGKKAEIDVFWFEKETSFVKDSGIFKNVTGIYKNPKKKTIVIVSKKGKKTTYTEAKLDSKNALKTVSTYEKNNNKYAKNNKSVKKATYDKYVKNIKKLKKLSYKKISLDGKSAADSEIAKTAPWVLSIEDGKPVFDPEKINAIIGETEAMEIEIESEGVPQKAVSFQMYYDNKYEILIDVFTDGPRKGKISSINVSYIESPPGNSGFIESWDFKYGKDAE